MLHNDGRSDFQRTGIFVILLAAAFITSMSTTVTGNMVPNFTQFFGVSSNLAQWLTSGATLISGITIPVTAFLIKRIPNKVYFSSAMIAYTAGSLAAFLALNFPMLLVSRLIQAVGCGMLLSFAQIVLLKLYPRAAPKNTEKSSAVRETHGRVVVLDGRQPACVLRLALRSLSSLPFFSLFLRTALKKSMAPLWQRTLCRPWCPLLWDQHTPA